MKNNERLIIPLMMYRESSSKGVKKRHSVVPSWNHLYTIGRGTVSLDKWAKAHKAKIEILTLNWIEEQGWETTINKKVYVDMYVFFPDDKLRDCHNLDKIVLDAFEDAKIFDNDANALVRYQDFEFDEEQPRIEVEFIIKGDANRKEKPKKEKQPKS